MNLNNRTFKYVITLFILILLMFFNLKNKNVSLENDVELLNNAFMEQMKSDSIPSEVLKFYRPNHLIYRYCEETCEKCVYEDLGNLNSKLNVLDKNRILIIPSFPDTRSNRIRLKMELSDFHYENIQSNSDIPLDAVNGLRKRYFVYFGANENECFLFIPKKSQNELTLNYLEWIGSEYMND